MLKKQYYTCVCCKKKKAYKTKDDKILKLSDQFIRVRITLCDKCNKKIKNK